MLFNKDIFLDRSTWESFKTKKHTIVVENEPLLLNYYGVIPINPKMSDVKIQKVDKFIEWLTSEETKLLISEFKVIISKFFSHTK